jgi:amino acid transporter
MSAPSPQLRRRRLGTMHIVFFSVAAVAPLAVTGGVVTATYAVTGVTGVPLSFIILAAALSLFAVGYAAMSRYVANAGAFYSYLANGLGPTPAVGGAFVALVSYNALQIGIYGLYGSAFADFISSLTGLSLPWWVWAAVALLLVGLLGVRRVDLNARVLAVLLVLECIVVVLYDIGAFGHPASSDSTLGAAFLPSSLFVPGVAAVFAFGVTAFIGFEAGAIYSEECRNPRVTVARATFIAVGFVGLFYAVSSWAMLVTVGPANIQQTAAANVGVVLDGLAAHWGGTVSTIAALLFLTSNFAALLSFHNGVARYLFALGRERVLPAALSRVGTRSGGPVAGSMAQTALAVVVLTVFVLSGTQPVLEMFTWLSGISAVGVVLLMAGTSAAVVGFFRGRSTAASMWQRLVAPTLATIALVALVALIIGNFDALLGTDPTSPLRWILPGIVLVGGLLGVLWALKLKSSRPDVYASIGTTGGGLDDDEEEAVLLDLPSAPRHSL